MLKRTLQVISYLKLNVEDNVVLVKHPIKRFGRTNSTFNTVRHFWIQQVECVCSPCSMMLTAVERSLFAIRFSMQRHSSFLVFLGEKDNNEFVLPARHVQRS